MFTYSDLVREARFLAKQRTLQLFLLIIFTLSAFSVWTGVKEIQAQQTTIEQLLEKDQSERANVLAKQTDYGSAAYYSFHLTYSEPESLAFAAIGQRDIYPWKHRIRMLAIEAQIYENDTTNPELSFLGRFDFAFIVSILAPLFVILLLHNLRSNEREAGRFDLLVTTAKNQHKLWSARTLVLIKALLIALLVPFVVGALYMQANLSDTVLMMLVAIAHVLFWAILTLWIGNVLNRASQSSARIASVLLGIWLLLTVILPVISDTVIRQSITSPNGGEIMLVQREAVNDAWDLPFEATWGVFLKAYPEWTGKTEMNALFEWKWYYAFQQVGDEKTKALSRAYRQAIIQKDKAAGLVAYLSPPVLSQRLMNKLAKTDISAALAYEQNVRDFHQSLRTFFYPLLFNNPEYDVKSIEELPVFSPLNTSD